MKKESKFAALVRSRGTDNTASEASPSPQEAQSEEKQGKSSPTAPKRARGRPGGQGKRLNPDYQQVTAYIPAKLHTDTKINLLRLPKKMEFSELVEELLTKWNERQSA